MAIRNVRQKDDLILRKKSKTITEFNEKLEELLEDLEDTMLDLEGAGIAGIQIGVLRKIFLADLDGGIKEFINPEIIEQSGKQINKEACLSLIGESGEVLRPTYVKIKAQNKYGEEFIYEARDFEAIILCHEYDHLEGIIFTDKVI